MYREGNIRQLKKTKSGIVRASRAQLLEHIEFLTGLLDDAGQPFVACEINGGMIAANRTFCDLVGYSDDELLAMPCINALIAPESRETEQAFLARLREAGKAVKYEKKFVRKDGSRLPLEQIARLFCDEGGTPAYYCLFLNVTAMQRPAEELLREREAELARVQELTHLGSYIWDIKADEYTCSDELYRVFGVEKGTREPTYSLFIDLVHPEDRGRVARTLQEAIASGTAGGMDYRILRPDGTLRWVHGEGKVISDEKGAPRMYGTVQDITGRKMLEESLKITQLAMDKFSDSAIWVSSEGRIVYVNEAACRSHGYSREELLSRHIWDIDPAYPPDLYARAWLELKRKHGFNKFESRHVTRGGHDFPVEVTSTFLQYGDKEFLITFDRDITPRKSDEKTLTIMQFAIDRSGFEIVYLDKSGQCVYVNDAMCDILGYTREELLSMHVWDFDPIYTQALWDESWQELKDKKTLNIESIHRTKDGRDFPIEVSANYIVYNGEEYDCAIVKDITDRKRSEEEIKATKAQAELYLDLMGHDINNLNQIALGYLELAYDLTKDAEVKELVTKPLDAINNSSRLIDNVRKLQKARLGGLKIEPIDLDRLLAELRSQYLNIPGKNIAIGYEPNPDCRVMANGLLRDVFSNLIGNAIKHARPQDSIEIRLGLERIKERGRDYFKVTVEDNGPGIPDAQKKKIFARFREENAKATGKGLGLYLARTLVEEFHGRLWVENRIPGDYTRGSRFVVLLPATTK